MRNNSILRILFLFVVIGMFTACEEEDRPYKQLTDDITGGVVQFTTTSYDLVVNRFNAEGNPENATYSLSVKVLGPPTNADRTVTCNISNHGVVVDDDGDTIMVPADEDMYELSSTSFTIKAGATTGSVDITLLNLKLPLEETVYFDFEITGGDIELATNTTKTMVKMFKKNFCPYTKADLVGDWDVVEHGYYADYYGTYHVSDGEGDTLIFTNSFWYTAPTSIWGEKVIDVGDPVKVILDMSDPINPNIYMAPPQYLMTTLDPNGTDQYPYWIADMNTYTGSTDYTWEFEYCDKSVTMYYCIPYAAADGGLVDIVSVTMSWAGNKKVAYINHSINYDNFNFIKKK